VKGRRLGVAISLGLMVTVAVAPAADAFGGRGGRGPGGALGGRPPGFSQPHFKPGFKGSFPGGPLGFGGYNRAFPGFDGPCPGPTGCLGFKQFNPGFFNPGFKGGFAWGGGAGWFAPWGTTTVYSGQDSSGAGPASSPVTYYAPQYYAPQYYAPASPPPAGGAISLASPPPAPSIVAFPGGHYELRGDGATAPYQWVWIPNPPSAPPAPPAAPPAQAAPSAPAPASHASRRGPQLYRWTDDQGTVHWTNREEAVPTRYRKEAKYPPPA
jgi:hypothetical protein